MGYNLVARIAVGPERITKKRMKEASSLLFRWAKQCSNDIVCRGCDNMFDVSDFDESDFDSAGVIECPQCGHEMTVVGEKYATKKRCTAAVEEAVLLWDDARQSRDSAIRSCPGKPRFVIVCCGDSSWGDEPQGVGYADLKQLFSLPHVVTSALGFC